MEEEKGILFAFAAALVSGISVFINGFAAKGFDAVVYTAMKNLIAAGLLFAGIMVFRERKTLLALNRDQLKWLVAIGIIGGGVPFLLYFQGLSMIAAAKGSFIFRLLFIASTAFSFVILKEKPGRNSVIGVLVVLGGNIMLLGPDGLYQFGTGEMLVLAATVIWGFEYVLSKKAMQSIGISPGVLGFGRLFFGLFVIFGFLLLTGRFELVQVLSINQWEWAAVTGGMLFLFVATFYSSLKFAKATTATSILTLGGPITAILNYIFLGKAPSIGDSIGLLLITAGIIAIVGISQLNASFTLLKNKFRGMQGWRA